MKAGLAIAGIVCAAAIALGVIIHKNNQAKERSYEEHKAELDITAQTELHRLDQKIVMAKAEIVRQQFGDSAATLYVRCHTDPPTTDASKRKCGQLDDRLQKWEAKHPKW